MQNEIISAEIYLHPVNVASATAEIDAELTEIEKSLKTCIFHVLRKKADKKTNNNLYYLLLDYFRVYMII